jgi:Ca2+:H+ antiporter
MTGREIASLLRHEWFLAISVATCLVFFLSGEAIFARLSNPFYLVLILAWLFSVMVGTALSVVRQADHLAVRLGEPYGTVLLTLCMTFIEVTSITAVMMHGENNPTLARDTMFATVMIILNGIIGLSLLIGAWRHREQHYNLRGANAYLGVIVPLVVLSLVLPNFTQSTSGPTFSFVQQIFLVLVSISLYCTFLAMQMGQLRSYFTSVGVIDDESPEESHASSGLLPRLVLLVLYLVPVVFLSEQLAHPIDHLIETLGAPAALGGVIVAVLGATPEALGAMRSALSNQLQRSINILLGSVLSTSGLTIPAMVLVSYFTGRGIVLGLEHTDAVMLVLTLFVSAVTFASGQTNALQGAVHLILFATYLLLIVQN